MESIPKKMGRPKSSIDQKKIICPICKQQIEEITEVVKYTYTKVSPYGRVNKVGRSVSTNPTPKGVICIACSYTRTFTQIIDMVEGHRSEGNEFTQEMNTLYDLYDWYKIRYNQ